MRAGSSFKVGIRLSVLAMVGALAYALPARAQNEPPPAPPADRVVMKRLGAGYKIGNGLGFVGADLIISPVEHLTLDLQVNWFSASSGGERASGYGVAPSVQFHLFKGQVSSPYLGIGFLHASLSLGNATASASGAFGNVGYEWRWESGIGILLGAGVARLGTVSATNGIDTVHVPGGTHFNLEVGVRYMFL